MGSKQIKEWQRHLKSVGAYAGRIDGEFNEGTLAASLEIRSLPAREFAPAKTRSPNVVYINGGKIRNRKVTANIEKKLAAAIAAVYGPGHVAKIYSGGQDRKGKGKRRMGSIRHDDYGEGGRAADVYVYRPDGTKVTGLALARLGQYWLAKGNGGVGLEMPVGGIHLDEWTTPPPGGGMFWTYPYSDGKSWGRKARAMLVEGKAGKLPKLA